MRINPWLYLIPIAAAFFWGVTRPIARPIDSPIVVADTTEKCEWLGVCGDSVRVAE